MSKENNKFQIDIDNLFKQNVNDLSAIKELYRKLKEVEERISQLKYIDSTLANKLKKEYEKLKRIILDENAAASLSDKIETVNENLSNEIETINENLSNEIERINEKITNDIETINSQLNNKISKSDNTVYAADFNIVGDGITDDTQAIQDMFNLNVNTVIFESGKKYLITKPIVIKNSNLNIDFNGATILWNGTSILDNNNGIDRYYGAFTFVGGTVNKKYTIKEINTDCSDENLISGYSFTIDDNDINKGDYIWVYIDMGEWKTDYSDYKPVLNRVCRVVSVDNNKIYTDLNTPFEFDLSQVNSIIVKKINLIENITIKNLNYKDLTEENFDSISTNERATFVGGLSFHCCRNIVCENIQSYNYKFPSIMLRRCYMADFKNIKAYDKSTSGGGLGYIIQVMQSVYVNIENCYGENVSPVVDFTTSAFCSIKNAGSRAGLKNSISHTYNKFTCHGQCEHDIVFDNCNGHFHFGNGIGEFPVLTENITIVNSSGYLGCEHVHNLIVNNSNIKLGTYKNFSNRMYGTNLLFSNCNIEIGAYSYTIGMKDRGKYNNKFLKFNNCNINVTGIRSGIDSKFVIRGFASVIINNCTCAKTKINVGSNRDFILCSFIDNYLTLLTNNTLSNLGFNYCFSTNNIFSKTENPTNKVKCINNTFRRTIDDNSYGIIIALNFDSTFTEQDNNWYIDIQNNNFEAFGITQQLRSIYFTDNEKPTNTHISVCNNYFNNADDWFVDRLSNCVLTKSDNIFINCNGGLRELQSNEE